MLDAEFDKQSLDLELTKLIDYENSLDKAWEISEYILNDPFDNYSKASDFNDYLINNPINVGTLLVLLTQADSLRGYDLAMKKLAKDPKQKALKEIEAHYQGVKSQFKRRGFSAEFVRDMHVKYPEITAIKTIENLVSALNKENDAIPR